MLESLEDRRLLAASWRNPVDSLDATNDRAVSPVDALAPINALNTRGAGPLTDPRPADSTEPYYDITGDGILAPVDPLVVINALNSRRGTPYVLQEGTTAASEHSIIVGLGQNSGSRTYRLELLPNFGGTDSAALIEDTLAIYLRDPDDPNVTLLDRGVQGSSLFTLAGGQADYVPGQVRFDGQFVEIDLTKVAGREAGRLVFQLINSDDDADSHVTIRPLSNEVDVDGASPPSLVQEPTTRLTGSAIDFSNLTESNTLDANLGNVRFDSQSGEYMADLRVRNTGDPIGRDVVIEFTGLPDGVVLRNASGTSPDGFPYLNLRDATPFGGLDHGDTTRPTQVMIDTPNLDRFSLQARTYAGPANQSPVFEAVSSLAVMPGDTLVVPLIATDLDGDPVTFSISPPGRMPTSTLRGSGSLRISPTPAQIGVYQFELHATDGRATTSQQVNLEVVADSVTTTRISGTVKNTLDEPLAGVPVELGNVATTTAADGTFLLEFDGAPPADALVVHGETIQTASYPFIAEKLPLLFARDVFEGVNNVIPRPIYLPALDVANAVAINPLQTTTVTVPLADNERPAEVRVAAGTLRNKDGDLFTGELSITEVPRDLTPAALPPGMFPGIVVTIQPGDMTFTAPAPLTLPNRAGYAGYTMLNLWSINPTSGEFEVVGEAIVSEDGSEIRTISGGIRNSSWHFVDPITEEPDDRSRRPRCPYCPATENVGLSDVELLTGAFLESHSLPTYQSLGATRGVTLQYDSQRVNSRPVVRFSYDVRGPQSDFFEGPPPPAAPGAPQLLGARLSIDLGNVDYEVPGFNGASLGLGDNMHFWMSPMQQIGQRIGAALQVDMSGLPTGVYPFRMMTGFFQDNGTAAGSASELEGQIIHVDSKNSPFGAGWGIAGWQQIVEHEQFQDVVLLLDGDGTEQMFITPFGPGLPYLSPPDDFSRLEKLDTGRFRRTLKDGTVYDFNDENNLESVTDRNGNVTHYNYDPSGRLAEIVDPAGLVTTFQYDGEMVSGITDPAGRETSLIHDAGGNLTRLGNPDGTQSEWDYSSRHLLVGTRTERGYTGQAQYDFAGRLTSATRTDGTTVSVMPAEREALYPATLTASMDSPPPASLLSFNRAAFADAVGHVTQYELDGAGQLVSATDAIGRRVTITRDDRNQIRQVMDGRGNIRQYDYDDRGNRTSMADAVSGFGGDQSNRFPGQIVSDGLDSLVTPDLNLDGIPDLVGFRDGRLWSVMSLGGGKFGEQIDAGAVADASAIAFGRIDDDALPDIAVADFSGTMVHVFYGNGDGRFIRRAWLDMDTAAEDVDIGDVNHDGRADVVALGADATLWVFLSLGNDQFAAPIESPLQRNGRHLLVEDLNSDGVGDLVVSNFNNSVTTFQGVGDGSFSAGITYETGAAISTREMLVADVNNDDHPDIVTINGTSASIFLNDGGGGFAAGAPAALDFYAVGGQMDDLDADGNLDLITTSGEIVAVYPGNGQGGFGSAQSSQVGSTRAIGVGDFNGDDFPDLMATGGAGVSFHPGVSLFTFQGYTPLFTARSHQDVTHADIDGDGFTDTVSIGTPLLGGGDLLSIIWGTADGAFGEHTTFPIRFGAQSVAVGALNGDTTLDFAITHFWSDVVSLLLSSGGDARSFRAATQMSLGKRPNGILVLDVDGDMRNDVVTTSSSDNVVSILPGKGDGTFDPRVDLTSGDGPFGLLAHDIDGDQRPDLVTTDTLGGTVSVLTNQGNFAFSVPVSYAVGDTPLDVIAVDVTQDAIVDLVVSNSNGDSVSILPGLAGGLFGEATELTARTPFGLVAGDLNRDGLTDIVVNQRDSIAVYEATENGGLVLEGQYEMPSTDAVSLSDANNDGWLDIFANSMGVNVLLNDGREDQARALASPARTEYDSTYNIPTVTIDELGRRTSFELDAQSGNVLAMTRADDSTDLFTYTSTGLIDTRTDALGRVTDYDYDPLGRLSAITFSQGTAVEGIQRFEYDVAGNQTAFMDENGNRTEFEHDDHNRLRIIRDAIGGETRYEYDAAGNIIRVQDAVGHVTSHAYDERNRLTRSIDSHNNTTRFDYDRVGNLTRIIDPLGNTTRNEYDARDRVTRTIDPDGGITKFRYELDDNLASLTDPVNNTTRFHYDTRDRLIRETDPLGHSTAYRYDSVDNLTRKTDRNLRITEFIYDDLDRLDFETWLNPDGSQANEIDYEYDSVGNLISAADAFSALAFTYDARYRVKTVDNAGTPGAPYVVLAYGYDDAGNVTSIVDTIDGEPGAATSYVYDRLDRQIQIAQTSAIGATGEFPVQDKRIHFGYNALGQFESIDRFADLSATQLVVGTTYAYDSLNRLERIEHTNVVETLAFYDYSYDSASRITEITDVDGVTDYAYDDRSQLTGANRADNDARGDEAYEYDANGNRTSSHRPNGEYRTAAANRLLTDGKFNYEYDKEGNLVRRMEIETGATRELEYDLRNRLICVVDSNGDGSLIQRIEFVYDSLNRRIVKMLINGVGDFNTQFVYAVNDVVLEFTDHDGGGPGQLVFDTRYLYGPANDQILTQEKATSGISWLLADHLGTVRQVVDENGALVAAHAFDSFGNLLGNEQVTTRFLFTGREFDIESGLYYFRARYYDPSLGLFLSADPLGLKVGTNLFAYADNDPLHKIDPFGLEPFRPGPGHIDLRTVEDVVDFARQNAARADVSKDHIQKTQEAINRIQRLARKGEITPSSANRISAVLQRQLGQAGAASVSLLRLLAKFGLLFDILFNPNENVEDESEFLRRLEELRKLEEEYYDRENNLCLLPTSFLVE